MKRTKMLRVAAVTVLGLSLGAGVASAAPGDGTVSNTGPDSNNQIVFNNGSNTDVDNDNNVRVRSVNPQSAYSGDTSVRHNTTGGNATSGNASNDSLLRASLRVSNAGSGMTQGAGSGASTGSIDTTGPDSNNQITFNNGSTVDVHNDNDITVDNWNFQRASTGDARVSDNTTGGNATSGSASNISTTDVTVEVNN